MLSVLVVLGISLVAAAIQEEVLISEIVTGRSREIGEHLPDNIELDIQRKDGTNFRLNLRENTRLNVNAPVYHSVTENGKLRTVKKDVRRIDGVKFYYDKTARAALKITCLDPHSVDCTKLVEGSLNVNGENYDIKPSQDVIVARRLGAPRVAHILEKVYINMPNYDDAITPEHSEERSFENKAYTEIKDRLAEILNGYKRHKRQEAVKTQYAVEVIGVADPTLWTYMKKRIEQRDGMSEDDTVEYEIRERIAHIVHGVSLNFEDIDDKEFSIYVTVSGFLIMKTLNASSPIMEKYLTYSPEEGYQPRTARLSTDYLGDLRDYVTNRKIPNDDHYMVFTWADFGQREVGVAYVSGCCSGNRVSLMKFAESFYLIISISSHELGHNLNASHDHYTCPGSYIMDAGISYLNRGDKEGTKHRWSFSTCSITEIREFLKTKGRECLLDNADIYDKDEWESHTSLLPGERYDADQQCKLLNGDFSYMCRKELPPTNPEFCKQMTCLHQNRWWCHDLSPAEGTQCGFPSSNSSYHVDGWVGVLPTRQLLHYCIKGKCVKKEGSREELIKTGDSENCFKTFSEGYQGTKSVTKSGIPCQSWSMQSPHRHVLDKPEYFKDDSVSAASNYCRDPDGTGTPWCYGNLQWDYCDIPKCPAEKEAECAKKVKEFQFKQTTTKNGYTCQRWDSQKPHRHSNTDPSKFPDASLADAANFCRNPNGQGSAWCYTTSKDREWDWCASNINSICPSETCYSDHVAYSGPTNVTKSGAKCQPWDKKEPHYNWFASSPNLYPDESVAAAGNSCRDPHEKGQPWCYLGLAWEVCDIPECT